MRSDMEGIVNIALQESMLMIQVCLAETTEVQLYIQQRWSRDAHSSPLEFTSSVEGILHTDSVRRQAYVSSVMCSRGSSRMVRQLGQARPVNPTSRASEA